MRIEMSSSSKVSVRGWESLMRGLAKYHSVVEATVKVMDEARQMGDTAGGSDVRHLD